MNDAIRKLEGRFSESMIDGEIVAMNLDNGDFFSLTHTGKEIWELIDGHRNRETIIDLLTVTYGSDRATIESDVDAFLSQLRNAGLGAKI
jgi:hypothetical protein